MKKAFLALIAVLAVAACARAANVDVKLDSISGESKLAVKNSAAATVGGIDSRGTVWTGAAGIHDYGVQNFFAGANSGNYTLTGSSNTAVGYSSLRTNTNGANNTAIGNDALRFNETGSNNTATGHSSLRANVGGSYNTAAGYYSLRANTGGNHNAAVGYDSLQANTGGNNNTAMGDSSLFSNTSGNYNTALGNSSLYLNNGGNNNTAVGQSALLSNTAGSNITALGMNALYNNTTGESTAVGVNAMYNNTTGVNNIAMGYGALYTNSTGKSNTAVGNRALYSNTADYNTAVGDAALYTNSTGIRNTALGYQALNKNPTNVSNTAVGFQALYNNTGDYNTAFGANALDGNTSGVFNTAIGHFALHSNTTGDYNVALGKEAGYYGTANTTENYNTFIGYAAGLSAAGVTNSTAIGSYAKVSTSDTIILGDYTNSALKVGIGTSEGATLIRLLVQAPNSGGAVLGFSGNKGNYGALGFPTDAVYARSTVGGNGVYADASEGSGIGVYGRGGLTGVEGYNNASSGTAVKAFQGNAGGFAIQSTGGINYLSGDTGIGTSNPAGYKLHVADTLTNGFVAIFENLDTGTSGDGIKIQIGPDANPGASNHFISFCDGNGTEIGSVKGTGGASVNFSTTGGDYAEYFEAEENVAPGYLVGLNTISGKARAWRQGDPLMGVVSITPGFTGNADYSDSNKKTVLIALVGQVEVRDQNKIILENGIVKTVDGQRIGYRLASGKVWLKY